MGKMSIERGRAVGMIETRPRYDRFVIYHKFGQVLIEIKVYISKCPSQHFSHVGTGLPGLNLY